MITFYTIIPHITITIQTAEIRKLTHLFDGCGIISECSLARKFPPKL